MLENQKKEEMNLSLFEVIKVNDVEEQCNKIANWFYRYFYLGGIGFFLQKNGLTRTYFYSEAVPKFVIQGLEEIHLELDQTSEAVNKILFFGQKEDNLNVFSPQERPFPMDPIGLIAPLTVKDRSLGTIALVTKPERMQGLTTETQSLLSLITPVSYLIDNAITHEEKDNKIGMLNLYQTVSSSLAYIGDLHELLFTIVSIVTAELQCEESSVLLYDEENNEFEFFIAVGETGSELEKIRFPADRGIAGRALRERKTQVVNDVQSDPDFYGNINEEHDFKTRSILSAPLISGDEIVGVINAINKIETKFFDQADDQALSAIADEVALAVKNAKLFDYVVDSYCKIRQGQNSCKGCKRPLKSWTPCIRQLDLMGEINFSGEAS